MHLFNLLKSNYYRITEIYIPEIYKVIRYCKYIELLNYIPCVNIYTNKNQRISKNEGIFIAQKKVENYFTQFGRIENLIVNEKITKENKYAWIFTFFTENALKTKVYDGMILAILVDKETGMSILIQCPHFKKHYVLKMYGKSRNNIDRFNDLFTEYLW